MKLIRLTETCWLATNEAGVTKAVRVNPKTLVWSIVPGFSAFDEKRAIEMAAHWASVN